MTTTTTTITHTHPMIQALQRRQNINENNENNDKNKLFFKSCDEIITRKYFKNILWNHLLLLSKKPSSSSLCQYYYNSNHNNNNISELKLNNRIHINWNDILPVRISVRQLAVLLNVRNLNYGNICMDRSEPHQKHQQNLSSIVVENDVRNLLISLSSSSSSSSCMDDDDEEEEEEHCDGIYYLSVLDEVMNQSYVDFILLSIRRMLHHDDDDDDDDVIKEHDNNHPGVCVMQQRYNVFELAQRFDLPHAWLLKCIKDALSSNHGDVCSSENRSSGIKIDGASLRRSDAELVSNAFIEAERDAIVEAFHSISNTMGNDEDNDANAVISTTMGACAYPVTIQEMVAKYDSEQYYCWDAQLVFEYVKESLISDLHSDHDDDRTDCCRRLRGELRGTGATAIYIPHAYTQAQKICIRNLYRMNGFVTKQQVLSASLLPSSSSTATYDISNASIIISDFESYVLNSFPEAVCLPSTAMINVDVIIGSLVPLFIEAKEASSYVDLNLQLPEQLLLHLEDVEAIVYQVTLRALEQSAVLYKTEKCNDQKRISRSPLNFEVVKNSNNCINFINGIILPSEGIWISPSLAEKFRTECLQKAIANFAIIEAEILLQNEIKSGLEPADETRELKHYQQNMSAKEKRKARQIKESKKNKHSLNKRDKNNSVTSERWEDLANKIIESNDLIERSRQILPDFDNCGILIRGLVAAVIDGDFSDILQNNVENKFNELRLEAIRQNTGGMRDRDVMRFRYACEQAFEEQQMFPASCILLQIFFKFVNSLYDQNNSQTRLCYFERTFIRGPCLYFLERLTEYALIHNDVTNVKFEIDSKEANVDKLDFSGPICSEKNVFPSCCQPLDYALRVFPDYSIRCSNMNKAGDFVDPLKELKSQMPTNVGVPLAKMWKICKGNFDSSGKTLREFFLNYARENCLLICGLPFKALDKKSEKQFLFERRRVLTKQLEETEDISEILLLSTLLLFQQVKGVAGFGDAHELIPLLSAKIPEYVFLDFMKISQLLSQDKLGDEQTKVLALSIKKYGLSKDISRF